MPISLSNSTQTLADDIRGKTIVFTGTLSRMTRNEAKGIAYKLGAKVSDAVGPGTDYLVVGQGSEGNSKLRKARRLGIYLIGEFDWYAISDLTKSAPAPKSSTVKKLSFANIKKIVPKKTNNDFPELDLD